MESLGGASQFMQASVRDRRGHVKCEYRSHPYVIDMPTLRMGLKHIEVFRAVMLTGSMTEASRRMHTSQPQISRLIAQLEATVRFPLFSRSGSRLTPTVDGSRFFEEVEKTFVGLTALEAAASNIHAFGGGSLSIAAMPRLAGGLLTRAVVRFKVDHPDVPVTIHSGSASSVNTWISSGSCDLGLAMLYAGVTGLKTETIHTMNCVVVLPNGHRLAKRRRIGPKDLEGEPFISFPVGSPPRESIDQVFSQAGVARRTVCESDLGSSVCTLVAAGLGISIINPLAALEERKASGIELRHFEASIPVSLALLYPMHRESSRLASTFAEHVRQVVAPELSGIDASVR